MTDSPPSGSNGWLRRTPWLWGILIWGLLLAGFLPLRSAELIGGDEGIELTKAWHWFREGHWNPEYWNDQPLTHSRVFALLFHLDPSPLGPRLWSVGLSMLLLGAVASLTHTLFHDRAAGLTAATLVALGPQTLHLSVSAVQEVPALALGVGAVALAWHPMTRRHPGLLGLSLLLVILGMAIKLTAGIYAAAAALGLVFSPSSPHPQAPVPRRLLVGTGYLAAAGLGVFLLLGAVDGRSTTEWLGSHWAAQQAAMDTDNPSHGSPWRSLIQYYPALALGSLTGIVYTILTWRRGSPTWRPRLAIWVAVGMGFNAAIRPWWMYYSLSLWIALAPLAGLGFCQALRSLTRLSSTHRPSFNEPLGFATAAFAAWIAMICLGWWTVSAFFQDFQQLRKCRPGRDHPVVRWLQASRPTDREGTVFSRESIWAFWSQLRTPGPLLVVTHKRFLSGDLDDQRLVTLVQDAAPDFLVSAPGWDPGKIPEWEPVIRHYQPARITEGRVIYAHHRIGTLPSEERMRW